MALDPNRIHHDPQLNLQELFHTPDGIVKGEISLDLSDLDFFGDKPIQEPVQVSATISNHGGAVVLEGEIKTQLQLRCDRCNQSFSQEKTVELHSLLADSLEDEEHDEIILVEGYRLPLDEVATTAFILEMDTKTLCDEDCQGLCITCGANLNHSPCSCPKVNDSPFAALANLFDDD